MTRTSVLGTALLICLGTPAFCRPAMPEKFVKIYLADGRSITAELARTDEERQKGLMFREKLLPDQGMLFVFESEGLYSFWMKNTLLPLDMIWIDKNRRVVHIARDVPPCKADPCPSVTPDRPGLYVLELAAGSALRLGLQLFDRLDFKF